MTPETLVDDHLHLSPKGEPEEALDEFADAGGTHAFSPSLLPGTYGVDVTSGEDYREVFRSHVELLDSLDTDAEVFPVVGVHPAEVPRLSGNYSLNEVREMVGTGLEIAAEFVRDGRAAAIGEIGRPHYDVADEVVTTCDDLLRKGFRLARDAGCAVQLHTERLDGDGVAAVAETAREEGLDPGRVVHHFSPPLVEECEEAGTVPSVLARSEFVEEAAEQGNRFMLETDYLDDPKRPGAVLGPRTVPRRTRDLLDRGLISPEDAEVIHRELPESVYGVTL